MHYIRYNVLYGYVLSRLQYWSEQVHRDDEKLLQQLLSAGNKERSAAKKQRAVELTTELLNTLIEKIVVHEAVKCSDGCRKQ